MFCSDVNANQTAKMSSSSTPVLTPDPSGADEPSYPPPPMPQQSVPLRFVPVRIKGKIDAFNARILTPNVRLANSELTCSRTMVEIVGAPGSSSYYLLTQ